MQHGPASIMGQRSNTLGEGDSGTGASERVCLQSKKKTPRFYVIKNKGTLTVLTRVVFIVLTLFSAGVITTSIWLMMDCRESFATVRPILPRNIQFCTNMGMPALFACCTVLFAIFGLGCTGRRLTGYALIIISSVEILQSVTALTFYKCNTMSRQEVMRSVNSSLLPCYSPSKSMSPFMSRLAPDNTAPVTDMSSFENLHRPSRITKKIMPLKIELQNTGHAYTASELNRVLPPYNHNDFLHQLPDVSTKYFRHAKRKLLKSEEIQVPLDTSNTRQTIQTFSEVSKRENIKRGPESSQQVFQQTVECSLESRYFWNLSQRLKKSEVSSCIQVCLAYQAVCAAPTKRMPHATKVPPSNYVPIAGIPSAGVDTPKGWSKGQGLESRKSKTILPGIKDINGFESKAEECGYSVYKYVSDLCYYDNKVILPISLCAPLLCIGMSACFIYFAYCDRKLKEESQSNSFIPATETISNTCRESLQEWGRGVKNCFKPCMAHCHAIWTRAVCGSCCTPSSGRLDSECSNSSHELLHLRAIPPSVTAGGALSPAISQYTINTSFSEDCSPPLPRRS